MKFYSTVLTALLLGGACAQTNNQKQMENKTEKQMKTKQDVAVAINKAVQEGNVDEAASYVWPQYIQHTPVVPDGVRGLKGMVSKIKNGELPAPKITNIRTIQDGDFVVLHHEVFWPNRKVMFEIFRFESGLAMEHWSGIADHPKETVSGNSMLDGATEVTDLDKTVENKQLVKDFVEKILIGGEFESISSYYDEDVIQHNPYMDNSIEGLKQGLEELNNQGISLGIKTLHKVIGQGNFVFTLSEGEFGGKPTAFFDLFRVANGKVVEHWDVIQEIPEQMAHTNGMF